jgi:hypothetical protein
LCEKEERNRKMQRRKSYGVKQVEELQKTANGV